MATAPTSGLRYRLGIDVGGTFTDFTVMDEKTGELHIFKTPSTPGRPQAAVINGLKGIVEEYGIAASEIAYFVHGTTIAVNTVIERSGARVGLLVTEGFRDLMTLGRSRLSDTYNFLVEKPEPLVPRHLVREVRERMTAAGAVHVPLDAEQVRHEALWLNEQGAQTIAICFLHAFRNDAHERRAKEVASEACPDVYVCTSAEVWPQMREYERSLVTLINAHVGPRMDDYFDRLLAEVDTAGVTSSVFITKSNGGVMTVKSARAVPVQTLVSGPASGVSGARFIGQLAGHEKVIALDMGGTSTEVAVIDRDIIYSTDNTVGDFQVVIPAVDVNSIGAGGGSIAWTDASGVLKVGPRSAGAVPGPACYDQGGANPTITDAYVVLGIIDPDSFLGGRMRLSRRLAEEAIGGLAQTLGIGAIEAAESVLRVATSNMYSALVPLMAQKGVDISEFALLTYGGAGPTHGFLLAREVGISTVIVPPHPGTLCALGCLVADVRSDFIRSVNLEIDSEHPGDAFERLRDSYRDLQAQAESWLKDEHVDVSESRVLFSADMRFRGQAFDIEVQLGDGFVAQRDLGRRVLDRFYERYRALYNVEDVRGHVEVVNARVSVVGVTPAPSPGKIERSAAGESAKPARTATVYLDGRDHETPVYDRDALRAGDEFRGPALVHQYDSTVFVPPDFDISVDAYGNLIGELRG